VTPHLLLPAFDTSRVAHCLSRVDGSDELDFSRGLLAEVFSVLGQVEDCTVLEPTGRRTKTATAHVWTHTP